jgi:2-oxoglutarate dehydrogenase E1 component
MVDRQRLTGLLQTQLKLPPNFNLHPKLKKLFQARSQMAEGKQPLDWAAGEALAFATLATEGCRVGLTGQDQRGTFSHRHAMLCDYETGHRTCRCRIWRQVSRRGDLQQPVVGSGVLGFEYGTA